MPFTPVKSSNIAAVGYDPASRSLTVQFKSGAQHAYAGVPPETYAELMAADSVGSFFHANIKSAFESEKVE